MLGLRRYRELQSLNNSLIEKSIRSPIDGRRPAFVGLERSMERSGTVSDTGTDIWRLRNDCNWRRAACDLVAADAARMQARRS